MASRKIGLWLIGAGGAVGGSTALGLAALRRGLICETGLVTCLPDLGGPDWVPWTNIVLGGHEIRDVTWLDAVWELHHRSGLYSEDVIRSCEADLSAWQGAVRKGTLCGAHPHAFMEAEINGAPRGETAAQTVTKLARDMTAFREAHALAHVVVINVATSEPAPGPEVSERKGGSIEPWPTSSLYALAAVDAGCSYVNFTPALGILAPGVLDRALQAGTLFAGRDGKTGETLVKSALAPMFAARHLEILTWAGHNLLGNRDGQALRDPAVRASKIRTKDKTVSAILGYAPATHVSIEYAESLQDWKTAWDLIHFEGFLGTKMTLQFTWQGSDSALAAPLILDLARLTDLEKERGGGGAMNHLAFFFKDPLGATTMNLHEQWAMLREHVRGGTSASTAAKEPLPRGRGSV